MPARMVAAIPEKGSNSQPLSAIAPDIVSVRKTAAQMKAILAIKPLTWAPTMADANASTV